MSNEMNVNEINYITSIIYSNELASERIKTVYETNLIVNGPTDINHEVAYSLEDLNIDKILYFDSMWHLDDGCCFKPSYLGQTLLGTDKVLQVYIAFNKLKIYCSETNYLNAQVTVKIQYTKKEY